MSLVNVPFFDTIYGLRPTSYPRPPYLGMASMASFSSPSATNLLRVSTGIAYRFSLASDLCSNSLGFCFGRAHRSPAKRAFHVPWWFTFVFFRTPDLLRSYGQIYRRGALLEYLILSFLSSDGFGDLLYILHFILTPGLSDTPVRPLPLLCLSLLRFRCYLFLWRVFCRFPLLF